MAAAAPRRASAVLLCNVHRGRGLLRPPAGGDGGGGDLAGAAVSPTGASAAGAWGAVQAACRLRLRLSPEAFRAGLHVPALARVWQGYGLLLLCWQGDALLTDMVCLFTEGVDERGGLPLDGAGDAAGGAVLLSGEGASPMRVAAEISRCWCLRCCCWRTC